MKIPDLSAFNRHPYGPTLLAVGWIDHASDFPRGPVPNELLRRIWDFVPYKYARTLGIHTCGLCRQMGDYSPSDLPHRTAGTAEIRVFWNGIVYAAPDMITHYIRAHEYQPPEEFIRAVLDGPQPATVEYEQSLLALITSLAYPFNGYHPRLMASGLQLAELTALPPPSQDDIERSWPVPDSGDGYYISQLAK